MDQTSDIYRSYCGQDTSYCAFLTPIEEFQGIIRLARCHPHEERIVTEYLMVDYRCVPCEYVFFIM